jgi:ABC-type multidrug transport system ATPase subunit
VLEGRQNLNLRLNISENAYYAAGIRGLAASQVRDNIEGMIKYLGLEKYGKKVVGQLSSGNRQKAALVSVLSYEPALLLLDEPTLGLDVEAVEDLSKILIEQSNHHERGLLITSHDMNFIDKVCTRVIILSGGEIVFNGSKEDIRTNFFNYRFKVNLPNDDIQRLVKDNHCYLELDKFKWDIEGESFCMEYNDVDGPLPLINWIHNQSLVPKGLEIAPISLEDAYKSNFVNKVV